jgi:predicted transcriptional regulator
MKVTFNISDATVQQLRALAKRRGTSMTAVIASGIRHLEFFQNEVDAGKKILVENANGSTLQVIFV